MTRPPMLAADHIRELVKPHSTTATVTRPVRGADGRARTQRTLHTVHHGSLLDQLEETITTSASRGAWGGSSFGSKPAGRIDCLAFLERLEQQSHRLALHHDVVVDAQPPADLPDHDRSGWALRQRLTALAGAIGDQTHPTVRAWWVTARVLTQHDGPPYAPNIPCPNETCDRWGTIRLRLDDKVAVCVECHTTWSDDNPTEPHLTFGRLTTWVVWASEHLPGPRHWVTDDTATGYPGLGYRVECPDPGCVTERHDRAKREAERLRAARTYAANCGNGATLAS